MAKTEPNHANDDVPQPNARHGKIDIDSPEREGNDIPSLLGSGAPNIKVRAIVGSHGIPQGGTQTVVQTEEVRLLVQQGLLEVVE